MGIYAVIDDKGTVINTVNWDGKNDWTPPQDTIAVDIGNVLAGIGWTYSEGAFVPPPEPVISKEELVNQAKQQKLVLLSEANTFTQPWQTQLILGIISSEDKASLTLWMKYYQQVQSVDVGMAPDITWPQKP